MLVPRFSIRTILIAVTGFALFFLFVGTAYRGQTWAWGVAIAVLSVAVTALVHAAWFGIVWLFARLPAANQHDFPPTTNRETSP